MLNHYKCYEAVGPTVVLEVSLVDQFDDVTVVVLQGKYFCNPVEKTAAGITFPIVDEEAHMTCYLVDNPTPYDIQVYATDQFGQWFIPLLENLCLCLPALKQGVTATEESTWGRIKSIYE